MFFFYVSESHPTRYYSVRIGHRSLEASFRIYGRTKHIVLCISVSRHLPRYTFGIPCRVFVLLDYLRGRWGLS